MGTSSAPEKGAALSIIMLTLLSLLLPEITALVSFPRTRTSQMKLRVRGKSSIINYASTSADDDPLALIIDATKRAAGAGVVGNGGENSGDYSQYSNWASEEEVEKLKDLMGALSPFPSVKPLLDARRDWPSLGAFRVPIAQGSLSRGSGGLGPDQQDSSGSVRWEVRVTSLPSGTSLPSEAVEVGAVVLYSLLWGDATVTSNRVVPAPAPAAVRTLSKSPASPSAPFMATATKAQPATAAATAATGTSPSTRFRELSRRHLKASERSVYHQLGGPTRVVTAGATSEAAAILEVVLIPPPGGGVGVMMTGDDGGGGGGSDKADEDAAAALSLRPDLAPFAHSLFQKPAETSATVGDAGEEEEEAQTKELLLRQGRRRVLDASVRDPSALDNFIGGLDEQLSVISRRVLATRSLSPEIAQSLGVANVRGLLLYGPPGCGKTLLARQLAVALEATEIKVVSGPEVLNKFVGTSEERVRELFAAADAEWHLRGSKSGLHVVILDELDAICRERGTLSGDTSGVRDSVVNQLLAKLDGVRKTGNVLVVGLTNRRELIDGAMLRPGRLEVHVEIGWPDAVGRRQILNVHVRQMLGHGILREKEWSSGGDKVSAGSGGGGGIVDEVVERTAFFSGAELAGVVRAAASHAVARQLESEASGVRLTAGDFELGLSELQLQLAPALKRRARSVRERSAREAEQTRRKQALEEQMDRLMDDDDGANGGGGGGSGERGLGRGGSAGGGGLLTVGKVLRHLVDDLGPFTTEEYEKRLVNEHHVGWSELAVMSDAQLKECGIASVGHRIRILAAVASARTNLEEGS